MRIRKLNAWHMLLIIPYIVISGLAYGMIAYKLTRDREPWFTLVMLAGLGLTITFVAWLGGIPVNVALWTFAGTGMLYVLLRLMFGQRHSAEMMLVPHILAVLALFFWGGFTYALHKAEERQRQTLRAK